MDDEGKTGDSVRGFAYAFTGGESVLATQERAQEPLDMGSRLELFVDDYLIESMDGVELKLHSPRSAGTALSEAPEPGASDTVFLTSRDQFHWDRRFLEAFIRPGRDRRNWMNRSNMVAFGVVATGSDEISLYVVRHFKFPSVHLQRMVLRTDGFVSARAGYGGGELITRPLVFQGESLLLNFATSAAGSIRVEIQDAEGNPLPGFALDDSPLIFGDQIEHKVGWDRSRSRKTSEEMLRRISFPKQARHRYLHKFGVAEVGLPIRKHQLESLDDRMQIVCGALSR